MFQQFSPFQNDTGLLLLLVLWVLPWKGFALWRAARLGEKWWFVAMLVLNTLAILEIVYIFIISKKKWLAANATANNEK